MIGFRSAGAFVASLIGAVTGLGKSEPASLPPVRKPIDPRDTVISAYCGRKGGRSRMLRALRTLADRINPPKAKDGGAQHMRQVLEKVRRDVAYDQRRNRRRAAQKPAGSRRLLAG